MDKSDIYKCLHCDTFYVRGDFTYCTHCGKEQAEDIEVENFIVKQAIKDYHEKKYEKSSENKDKNIGEV